jgi:WhiB family redox-sensing transcriptional regulator
LGGALDRAESFGVWGGELVVDGVIVKVKRGRGRPPKTPRPPLVVDEVPLPPHLVA